MRLHRAFALCLFAASPLLFAQNFGGEGDSSSLSRGSIPEELLRPRRDESPRYPIDTVIGALGQGGASREAYLFAREVAAALLAGNKDAASLSVMNRAVLERSMSALDGINPRSFRLGGGREEPDGAVSFLIRFIGREQGITGELFVRLEERPAVEQPAAPPPAPPAAPETSAVETAVTEPPAEGTVADAAEEAAPAPAVPPPPVESRPAGRVWVFEDLILEDARSREAENEESEHRFDFPPYERFF